MPRLLYAPVPGSGASVGFSGTVWWLRPLGVSTSVAASEFKQLGLPSGTQAVGRRPSWAKHTVLGKTRNYGVGGWTANVLFDEHFRILRQGIPAPNVIPALTASGTGVTGSAVPYLRFLDSRAGRVGPLSAAGALLALVNQGRSWGTFGGGTLPTTCLDPSVDMLQGLVSMDGATPRVAWTRQLGVTVVVENVATLALGEAAPATNFTEMPLGTANAVYHDRQAIVGNEREPEAMFLSALGFLERYEGLKFTSDGDKLHGCFVGGGGDVLFAGSQQKIYRLSGFTEGDFTWEIDRPDLGLVCHDGVVTVHKYQIVPTTEGVFLYTGSWVPLMKDRRKEWIREYRTWRDDYDNAFGFFDPVSNVYQFGPVRHTRLRNLYGGDVWTYWTLDCQNLFPESGGNYGAEWGNDVRARRDYSRAAFVLPGSAQVDVVTGSEDGILRLENQDTDDGDDGDSYGKRCIIEPPSVRPRNGRMPLDGSTFHMLGTRMESESRDWSLEVRAGGIAARLRAVPDFTETNVASGTGVTGPLERQHSVLELCAGDALNLGIVVDRGKGFKFGGFDVGASPGGIGGAYARAADGRGLGPGQVVNLTLTPGGGPYTPGVDACGNAVGNSGVTWTYDEDQHLIADDTQQAFYSVARSNALNLLGGTGTVIRVKRFDRPVSGESNLLVRGLNQDHYGIGMSSATVSAAFDPTSDSVGTILATLTFAGSIQGVRCLAAENGVLYFALIGFGSIYFYKFTVSTLTFTLDQTLSFVLLDDRPVAMFSLSGTRYIADGKKIVRYSDGVTIATYPSSDLGHATTANYYNAPALHEQAVVVIGSTAYLACVFTNGHTGVIKFTGGVATVHRYAPSTIVGYQAVRWLFGSNGNLLLELLPDVAVSNVGIASFDGAAYALVAVAPFTQDNHFTLMRYRASDTRMWGAPGLATPGPLSKRSNAADFTVWANFDALSIAHATIQRTLKFIP